MTDNSVWKCNDLIVKSKSNDKSYKFSYHKSNKVSLTELPKIEPKFLQKHKSFSMIYGANELFKPISIENKPIVIRKLKRIPKEKNSNNIEKSLKTCNFSNLDINTFRKNLYSEFNAYLMLKNSKK